MPPPVLSNPNAEVLSYVQRAMEPVGSFKDDVTLITALREATQNGLNPNQALNSLHGVCLCTLHALFRSLTSRTDGSE